MKDREEYFCKAAARQSLFAAVWIVALVALIAWLAYLSLSLIAKNSSESPTQPQSRTPSS